MFGGAGSSISFSKRHDPHPRVPRQTAGVNMIRRSNRRRRLLAAELWREEQAWMSATRCSELLQVGADISERKWRLFAVECCRAILPMCPKLWHRETFERSERIADSASPDAACEGISELYNEFTWRQRSSEWSSRPRWSRVGRREEESTEELIAAERALL